MMKHNCHNHEYPDVVTVQDGWREVVLRDSAGYANDTIRVPRMIEIPFKMSKGCHQWDEPFGAVLKGLLDPEGCEGCKWAPKESSDGD